MKIAKWIMIEQEVEVEVDAQEMVSALCALADPDAYMQGANAAVFVLRALDPSTMRPGHREIIANAIREQAERFAAPTPPAREGGGK
jgi:hypothetical protein